jgi:hypothetical protein
LGRNDYSPIEVLTIYRIIELKYGLLIVDWNKNWNIQESIAHYLEISLNKFILMGVKYDKNLALLNFH